MIIDSIDQIAIRLIIFVLAFMSGYFFAYKRALNRGYLKGAKFCLSKFEEFAKEMKQKQDNSLNNITKK